MSTEGLSRSDSVKSFTSDMLDEDDGHEDIVVQYKKAPWDVIFKDDDIGDVVVAKEGADLPLTTNYYKSNDGKKAFKFLVSNVLGVTVVCERDLKQKGGRPSSAKVEENNESTGDLNLSSNPPKGQERALKVVSEIIIDDVDANPVNVNLKAEEEEYKVEKGRKFRSLPEFLQNVDENFDKVVIEGMEAGLRKSVKKKLMSKEVLNAKENMSVVHSLNQVLFDEFGPKRPDTKLCQSLGEILKEKFPQTFRVEKAVKTSFGTLKIKKSKGEGGSSALAKRIGDNFYSKYTSKTKKGPTFGPGSSKVSQPNPGSWKEKKVYGVKAEKYNYGIDASKAELEGARESFKKLDVVDSLEEKKHIVVASRAFIQNMMRTLQPSQAVEDLALFWSCGPEVLSYWFEWIVGGSKDGHLATSVELQMDKVMNIIEQYIVYKKGSDYEKDIHGVKEMVELHHGNQSWFKIFLLRDLGKLFRNKSEKLVFVDGEDEINTGPNEQQPNIFVTKQNVIGEEEFDEKVTTKLRIGLKVIYDDITFSQALAGCIQLYFCFHSYYPEEADDLFNVVQRICCNYGDWLEGANNKKGLVKKGFRDFEVKRNSKVCFDFKIFMFQSFAAQVLLRSEEGELMAIFKT